MEDIININHEEKKDSEEEENIDNGNINPEVNTNINDKIFNQELNITHILWYDFKTPRNKDKEWILVEIIQKNEEKTRIQIKFGNHKNATKRWVTVLEHLDTIQLISQPKQQELNDNHHVQDINNGNVLEIKTE